MDFTLSGAMGHTECQDDPTCEGDKYILCFRDIAQDIAESMGYLSCVDQLPQQAWPSKNAQCVPSSIAAKDVEACFVGHRSEELLTEARDYYWKRWPQGGFVPLLLLNNETYKGDTTEHPVDALLQAFCETGIQAAACFAPSPPSPSPSPPPAPTPRGKCDFDHGYISYSDAFLSSTLAAYEQQCCDFCAAMEGCAFSLHKISTGECKMYSADAVPKLDQYQKDYWVCSVNSGVALI